MSTLIDLIKNFGTFKVGPDCWRKKDGHKDDATYSDKKGNNTKRDHLWNLWCEPVTNDKVTVIPAGATTKRWWCRRELVKIRTQIQILIKNVNVKSYPLEQKA